MPPPVNYMAIALESVFLALSGLFIRNVGATYVGAVGGLLTALGNSALGLFTFLALVIFGMLVDFTLFVFKIKGTSQGVNRNRLIIAMAISTMLIGIITYGASVMTPNFIIQRSWVLDIMVVFMGFVTGATAGYAAAYLWNKYLKSMAETI
ncbi:MAG: hypothetical protein FWH37_04000 [Candidatus Bathyarchaeota archaeon]|nr:hypothetical protein [Candidatus Termiticorpusculum sp.]